MGRAVTFPPPLEIAVDHGMYVLVDGGDPANWQYHYIADQPGDNDRGWLSPG